MIARGVGLLLALILTSATIAAADPTLYDLAITQMDGAKLYRHLSTGAAASPDAWRIDIGYTTDCRGQHVCTYGSVSGSLARTLPHGRRVRLPDGSPAVYQAAVVGAYCGDASLSFFRAGERLTIAQTCAQADDLIALARTLHAVTSGAP